MSPKYILVVFAAKISWFISFNSSLIHSALVRVNNFTYLKFNSHLLVIGGGSQEQKVELRSEKLSVTPVGGRSQCGTQQGEGGEDIEENLGFCVRELAGTIESPEL